MINLDIYIITYFLQQAMPDSLTQFVRQFTHDLVNWLHVALDNLPENLRNLKIECKYLII